MKISTKRLRQIIREELINEINAAGLPPAANDFNQIPSLQRGYNDLIRTYENALTMQAIVHNNSNASQMSNQELDNLAAQYAPQAKEAAQKFTQELRAFLEDHFVESLRSFSRGNRNAGRPQVPAHQPAAPATAAPAAPKPQRRANDTIAPPPTQR
jgi:hypothetical protein